MQALKNYWARIMNVPLVRFIVSVGKRFGADNGGIYAGALSFFMLLAFVPMVLTGVAILAHFLTPEEAAVKVQEMVQNLLPAGGASQEATHLLKGRLNIDDAAREVVAKRGIAGVLGFLTLVWASMQIFINASAAMNNAWETKESRNWFVLRGVALALMAASGVLIVVTLFLSGAPDAIMKFDLPVIHHLPIPLWVLTLVFEVIAVIVNAVLYLLIFKFLPNAKVPWKAALIGGLAASIAWEIVKKGVAAWILRPNHSIYGGLADLILFVLWIYYSMMILLVGAEIAAVYAKQEEKAIKGPVKAAPAHPLGARPEGKPPSARGERTRKPSHGRAARVRR